MRGFALGGMTAIAACLVATAAEASEKPLYQPAPAWVKPAPAIDPTTIKDDAPIFLTLDTQERLQDGSVWSYHDVATRMASAEVVQQAGTITLPWQPAKGDLTIHRLEIIRGAQHIDVLAGGKTFTVIRREQQLERQAIDGELTATLQVEGLQVGDILHVTFTISNREETLGGAVQDVMVLAADPVRVGFARTRLVWPVGSAIKWKSPAASDAVKVATAGGEREVVITGVLPKAPDLPGDAPQRFQRLPLVEATSFSDWAAVSKVMAPLYVTTDLIKPGGDLAMQIATIKAAQADPLRRADAALELVQGKVRYLFNGLDKGNYVPQTPEQTWTLKYGDCKAKTVLLLAILRALDIEAEPVLANLNFPDRIPDRLPSAAAFNHVLVRATIGGQIYWLDGTGSGTRFAALGDVPPLRWVLPVRSEGAGLMPVPAKAPATPVIEIAADIDQRAGVWFPAVVHIAFTTHGALAEFFGMAKTQGSKEQKDQMIAKMGLDLLGTEFAPSDYTIAFDPVAARATIDATGVVTTLWRKQNDRYRMVIDKTVSAVSFDPDRARPAWQSIPVATGGSSTTVYKLRVMLPGDGDGFTLDGEQKLVATLAGVTIDRRTTIVNGTITVDDRAAQSGIEIAPADIAATRTQVALAKTKLLTVVAPATLPPRWQVAKADTANGLFKPLLAAFGGVIARDPTEAYTYNNRSSFLIGMYDFKSALPDLDKAIGLSPTAVRYLTRAYVLRILGADQKALADMQAALKLEPANAGAIQSIGFYLIDHGKSDAANALVQDRIDAGGDQRSEMMGVKADFLAREGSKDAALTAIDQAIAVKTGNPLLLNARCWIKGQLNVQLDTALKDCTKAIELSDYSANILDSRALVYFRMNRFDDALADLDGALAQNPAQASSLYLRGIIRKRQGKTVDAAQDLEAATFMQPLVAENYKPFGIVP